MHQTHQNLTRSIKDGTRPLVSVGIDGSNSMNTDVNALQVRPER